MFFICVLGVLAYAWSANRHTVAQNATTIERQRSQLAYLCETVAVLDQLAVQQERLARTFAVREHVPPWARSYLSRRASQLGTTHDELSESRGCRQIE